MAINEERKESKSIVVGVKLKLDSSHVFYALVLFYVYVLWWLFGFGLNKNCILLLSRFERMSICCSRRRGPLSAVI